MSGMGAMGGNLTTVLSMVGGAVIGRILQSKLESKVNPKLLAGGQVAVGLFLPKFVKSKLGAGLGAGMVVNGGVTLLNQFGVISAISGTDTDVEYIGAYDYSDDMGYADSSIAGDFGESAFPEGDDMGYAEDVISGDEYAGYDY
jgi:hypothetical protein